MTQLGQGLCGYGVRAAPAVPAGGVPEAFGPSVGPAEGEFGARTARGTHGEHVARGVSPRDATRLMPPSRQPPESDASDTVPRTTMRRDGDSRTAARDLAGSWYNTEATTRHPIVTILPIQGRSPLPMAVAPIVPDAAATRVTSLPGTSLAVPEIGRASSDVQPTVPMPDALMSISVAPRSARDVASAPAPVGRQLSSAAPAAATNSSGRATTAVPLTTSSPDDVTDSAQNRAISSPSSSEQPPLGPISGARQGTIVVDGASLGRWILDHLAREASRPAGGTTAFDPRISPTYPGAPIG